MSNALNLSEINQEEALKLGKFFIKSKQNLFLFGRRGVGKQLSLDTDIPTPNGFIKLKDLKEGDQLFDEQGNICNVSKLHPIQLSPESYEITFDDGEKVKACADHLWLTWDKKARKYFKNKNTSFLPKVRNTKEILNTLKVTLRKESNHSILCTDPINFVEKDLIISPYVLGCWLGDGQSVTGSIECADVEILNEIKKEGYSFFKTKKDTIKSLSFNYRLGDLVSQKKYGKIGLLKKQLKEYGLLKNKHIPEIYLRGSFNQRLSLLQGLLDTDGCCLKSGRIEFSSSISTLAYQVKELISSLGIKCFLNKNKSYLNGKQCKDRFRITFITKLPVFRLKRKLNNLKQDKSQLCRNTHRYIVDIQKIISEPMRCITVDSDSHLFLITKSFIPTHNTHIILQAADECKVKVNYVNLSVIERPDLAGYPDIHAAGDVVTYKSPQFLPKLLEGVEPDSIILFDEVDKAPPEVTSPLLEILQFGKINNNRVNAMCCILTGNLMNENAYSNQISSALLDRGAKYILSFNFDKWIDWAKTNDVNDLILGFLKNNTEFACGKVEDSNYASPSPRSWTQASEALLKAKTLKISDIDSITQIISGFVGSEAGLRFKIWYENFRKFEPFIHSLIDTGSMSFNFNALSPSEKLIFSISACYYTKNKVLTNTNKSKNRFVYLENLCKFFKSYEMNEEVKVMGLNNSFDFNMITRMKLYECKEFFDLFNHISEKLQFKK